MKRRSGSLAVREIQIKTAMTYHLTCVRTAIIETGNDKCWRGCGGRTRNLIHCWRGCKLVPPPQKTIWRVLKELRIELPYDPEIPLLCSTPKIWIHLFIKIYVPLCSLQHYGMDGSREYHAEWNKSGGKKQQLYDFTHAWDIQQKATNKQIHRHR